MHLSSDHIRRVATRRSVSALGQTALNVAIFIGVTIWGIPWFGPLLIPATLLFFVSAATLVSSLKKLLTARPVDMRVDGTTVEIGSYRHDRDEVRAELRPQTLVIWKKHPSNFSSLNLRERLSYMSPVHNVYVGWKRGEEFSLEMMECGFDVEDRRPTFRVFLPAIYAATVAIGLAMLAVHALKWIGVGAVLALSGKLGSFLGIHPGVFFLVLGGIGLVHSGIGFSLLAYRYLRSRLQKRSDPTQ